MSPLRRAVLLSVAAALLARGIFLAAVLLGPGEKGLFQPDSPGYWSWDPVRTPVYPGFLALLKAGGASPAGAAGVQALLSAVSAGLAALLAGRWTGSAAAALGAGLLAALDLPSILSASLIMTETLFTLLLLLACLPLVLGGGARGWAASGVLGGLCILCRPISILLPLAFLVPAFRRGGRGPAAWALGCLLVLVPWLSRTASPFGPVGDWNLLHCRAAGALAVAEGIPLEEAQRRLETGLDRTEWRGTALRTLREHPWAALWSQAAGIPRLLFLPERSGLDLALGLGKGGQLSSPGSFLKETSGTGIALVAVQGLWLALAWGALPFGLKALWRRGERLACWLILVVPLCLILPVAGPEAYARFRVPLVPFLAVAAGAGLALCRSGSRP